MGAKQSSANVTFSKPGASANKSGYIWVAPLGTTIPTDATTELDAAFVGLGYLSEDGLTEPASPQATPSWPQAAIPSHRPTRRSRRRGLERASKR